ncbi:rubrerythrin family protein [Halomarina salina]|uniref:Rubrerythrin family protein n=1 Tax=Halomarina salina TaxID=1872699 RepID=A0ABD5RL56_9EURY|nr:rubrerythrin family protein [Halomarina salina]
MEPAEFTAALEDEKSTELDRLGSEKALVASTSAQLDAESVLAAAARAEARAADTFDQWAASESAEEVRETFERVAADERAHYERIVEHRDDAATDVDSDPDTDELHDYLRSLDGSVERVASGLVARPMVASRSLLQTINFFVNDADESSAALFRELRSETDEMVDEGTDLLDALCESDDDWDRAAEAAEATIDRAYDSYADTLEGMGVDPKPVC